MGSAPPKRLAEAFGEVPPPAKKGPKCNVAILMDQMSADERDALEKVMGNHMWTNRNIVNTLAEHGYVIGLQSITRHRREECRCPR